MTMAFDVKKQFVNKIPAVIHPADKTTRPQMLKKQDNPDYYDLISKFKSITKLPLLLNTHSTYMVMLLLKMLNKQL